MAGYLKKIFKLTTNIFVFSIIINATDKGRIQVLLNIDNCDKDNIWKNFTLVIIFLFMIKI